MENFNQLKNNVESKEGRGNIGTSKEILPEIFKEIRDDIEKGECGYLINTKTNAGELFKGHKTKENEDFRLYNEASAKDLKDEIEKWKYSSNTLSSKVSFIHWDKFGSTAILLSPQETQKELKGRIKEELCRLSVEYQNDVSKFDDKRANSTAISFLMKKRLAENILNKVREKPDDLLNFIRYLEPELLNVAPISKKSYYSKTEGIVIFREDKAGNIDKYRAEPTEILQWGDKEESKEISKEYNIDNRKYIKQKEVASKVHGDVSSQAGEKLSSKKIEAVTVENLKDKKITNNVIKKETEDIRLENKSEEEKKKQFIDEHLPGILNGGLLVGEVPYSFPKGFYEIEKKGFLKKKYVVTNYANIEREFETFEKADSFMKEKKEQKAKEDLGKVWEILNGKRNSFYE